MQALYVPLSVFYIIQFKVSLLAKRVSHYIACHEANITINIRLSYHFSPNSRRVAVSYNGNNVHEVLVNFLVKLDREKVWLHELTVSV